jgi:hypothetical protein
VALTVNLPKEIAMNLQAAVQAAVEQMRKELLDIATDAYVRNLESLETQHRFVIDGINARFGVTEASPEISEEATDA